MAKSYSSEVAAEIKSLLREKPRAPRNKQKTIRAKLRKLGFDIDIYKLSNEPFRAVDFDRLVELGQIEVVDKSQELE